MRPPSATSGTSVWVSITTPVTWVSSSARTVATSMPPSGVGAAKPALLTSTSNPSRPHVRASVARRVSAKASKVSGTAVSSCNATAVRPSASISATTAFASSAWLR
jgi:hypothetical protein